MLIKSKRLRRTIFSMLTLSMLVAFCLPMQAQASSKTSEERKVQELAAQLEFLMEEALVVKNGEKTFDFKKIKNEFGTEFKNELKAITKDLKKRQKQERKQEKKHDGRVTALASSSWMDCMIDALLDHFGVALITAALQGGLWGYLQDKAYKKVAKLLLRVSVGFNATTLAGAIMWYGGKCTWKHPLF